MPSSTVGQGKGIDSADQNALTASSSNLRPTIDALQPFIAHKGAVLGSAGYWGPMGGPCPCFAWLTGRPAITDKDDIQLAEAQSWDSKYKSLWSDGSHPGRRRKPQRATPDESKLSITFGHKDTSKVRPDAPL
jgi:hypothetical protein